MYQTTAAIDNPIKGMSPYVMTLTKNIEVPSSIPVYRKMQSVENTYS